LNNQTTEYAVDPMKRTAARAAQAQPFEGGRESVSAERKEEEKVDAPATEYSKNAM
jgi:hypothetical protein